MDVQKALLTFKDIPNGENTLVFLHLSSYFAAGADIEVDIFEDTLGGSEYVNNAVELLKRRSLVQTGDKEGCIRIPKEVQKEVRNLLRQEKKEETVLKLAIEVLNKPLSSGSSTILDHAMSVFETVKGYPELLKKTSEFPVDVLQGLLKLDRDSEAAVFGRSALDVFRISVGEYHTHSLSLQRGLGMALLCEREIDKSLEVLSELYQRIAAGTGQRDVDKTLTLIVKVTSELTSKPESGVRRLVFGDVPVSETNNNSTLNLWSEYALMLSKHKWKDEALSILNQVLEKRRSLLNPDDDDICEVEDSIAHVHYKKEDYRKALEVYQRVYQRRSTILGENCLKTLLTRRGIAQAYESLEMYDEALIEYEAVADNLRKIVGDDGTSYLSVRGKIAYMALCQKKHEKSLEMYNLLYADYARVLGEKDIQTLNIKYNIGGILFIQDKNEEALSVWSEVLQGYIEVHGPKDPETVDLMQKIFTLKLTSSSGISELLPNLLKIK